MAEQLLAPPRRLLRVAPVPLALSLAVVTVAVPKPGLLPPTTYAAVSTPAHAGDLGAGLGLLAAGLLAWLDPGLRRLGALAMLGALAWFAPDWEGWDHGTPAIVSVAAAASPVFAVLVLHLLLAAPRGRTDSRAARAVLAAAYAGLLAVVVGRALLRDPLLDPTCWRNCVDNVFLVRRDPGAADALERCWLVASLAIGAVGVGFAAWRLITATRIARRALLPLVIPAATVAATEAIYALALLRDRFEDPSAARFVALYAVRCAAVLALATGIAWTVARARRLRASVGRLARELGEAPPPGALRASLASAVGDPTLEVSYPLGDGRYVGADGRPAAVPRVATGRAVTPIVREGRVLAVVTHDAGLLEGPGVVPQIGSAARLAVENERLQAEVLARLVELRASRARIVEQGDAERRRLERDLHDGAQQRLLALSYDLRLARSAAGANGDDDAESLLGRAEEEAHAALEELRRLAHGIFPAVLAEAGLVAAISSFADEAPIPVEPGAITPERFRAPVETAAYVTIVEAVDDAASRGATYVAVDVGHQDEHLELVARDDGASRPSHAVRAADRIGALGGTVEVGPTSLHAEIPCE